MKSLRFSRFRGPKILTKLGVRIIFLQCLAAPGIALIASFLLGSIIHPSNFYNYKWTCGTVHLPSISRIMNMPMERTIFHLLILTTVPLRLIVLFKHWLVFYVLNSSWMVLVTKRLLVLFGFGEVLFLSLLTVIGERENGSVHVVLFSIFVAFSYFYFCTLHLLSKWTHKRSDSEQRTIKLQLICLTAVTFTIPLIFLLFIFHNVFCIPGSYELFALFEYITLAAIYGFHASSLKMMSGMIYVYHTSIKLRSIRL
ncbi:hypothetical protein DICVIV_10707 [Dictyocaulus viviparus]|uniref:CWH43-like N-terminal domain-containing protein n=1 Tax=Dictyocaulus viviparus TaxID=29172 RepID=A0A0D8XF60_DICVI|nr:hypothetical protein DICVIV_10707 [Dictyocaulus viviparus]